ncbi:MAG: GHKL domain-containing protein [Promethearchaeota archaeon]|nr:MAG: GHKL domain-containing protein [Candidatus Lokiarchaeota archaeon]
MKVLIKEQTMRIVIILILIIISFLLIYSFELILKTSILVAHFFYFPSILACLWWKKKGLIVPVFLAAVLIVFHIILDYGIFNLETINNFLRGISLIVVGLVVSILSGHIMRRQVEFNEIMEDLRRSNEDLQQFAYVASHDLQEPLRAIVSFSQLLEDNYKDKIDKDGKEFIHFITDGAKKMNTLIKDLLTYSRITTHAQPSKMYNLEIILNDAIFNLQESIKESGVEITYDEMPVLKVDKTQFIQLFQNLLSNSIKFRSQEPPRIHIGVKKINDEWLFSVKDNGIGIESKFFDKLFNIFYRLHTKEEYPGTGIGLPICKKIIQRYGGKIWVESEFGKGSTFFFTIFPKKNKS